MREKEKGERAIRKKGSEEETVKKAGGAGEEMWRTEKQWSKAKNWRP